MEVFGAVPHWMQWPALERIPLAWNAHSRRKTENSLVLPPHSSGMAPWAPRVLHSEPWLLAEAPETLPRDLLYLGL